MGVEWTEISYLRGQERVCNEYVCVCVFTYYLASAFTPAAPWTKVDKHAEQHQVLPDGGRVSSDSPARFLFSSFNKI